jgi:hypothetical protein
MATYLSELFTSRRTHLPLEREVPAHHVVSVIEVQPPPPPTCSTTHFLEMNERRGRAESESVLIHNTPLPFTAPLQHQRLALRHALYLY